MSIRKQLQFSIWKRAIFRKVKETKDLSGGVVLYAAQSNSRVDAEIAEKGRFRTKTSNFSQDQGSKDLSGGVVLYAAQSNPRIDAEIAGKGRFRTKTI